MTDDKIEKWINKSTDLQSGLIRAIEEYAQLKAEQEAIKFKDWCDKSEYTERTINGYEGKPDLTTEELFKLYKYAPAKV